MAMIIRRLPLLAVALVLLASCAKKSAPSVAMLKPKDKEYVAKTLAGIKDDVRVVLFSRDGGDCEYCAEAEGMLSDIAAAAPQVKLEILSLKKDAARAKDLGIERTPGMALLGKRDFGMRYFGLPSGYEFIPFVETLRSVGNADPGLAPETVAALGKLQKPVQLTVFVTQH
jgi:alkyl hydroperoxide reductase subunit AhpF